MVRQLEAALRLMLQLVQHRQIMNDGFREKLQRHIAIQLIIPRQPDHAHSAPSKNPDQRVTAKQLLASHEAADRLS